MSIDRDVVRRVAALAHLRLDPSEEPRFVQELQAILAYVEQLQALDISGVEPTSQVGTGAAAALRPDAARECDVREEVLEQAPDRDGEFFRVPKVV